MLIANRLEEEKKYRCFARIDLNAIRKNFMQLKSRLQPGVRALAVVKADAYGHGSVPVASYLEKDADYFGVATLEEALALRQGGIQKPILILSYTTPYRYRDLIENEITATIFSLEEAGELARVAEEVGKKAKIHLAVDTGMGRIGVSPTKEGADLARAIFSLPWLEMEGVFSHYACADCRDLSDAEEQTKAFDFFLGLLEERGVRVALRHICNSAGSMTFSKQYDMCRLGIAMYGLYPSEEVEPLSSPLIPAMEVVSHVIHVKEVPAGFSIGYGHTYTAPEKRRIATVCVGYADGFNRCLSGGVGYVLIRGKKAPVVGRVCMDQIMVDVSDLDEVSVGDEATVLGENEGAYLSAEELGALCHSFNYEVVCNFMPRVKRIYYR